MKIYQIQITLTNSNPIIWRRFLIQPYLSLSDFHMVIQIIMGWRNSHLHQFIKNETFYSERLKDDASWEDLNNVDYKGLKISDLLVNENDKIDYEYDFGDSWHHDVILEKILLVSDKSQYLICLDGKLSCPPEDCGGIWGYADLLQVFNNPKHKDYADLLDWLDGEFDPDHFDKEAVNKILKKYIKLKKL
jgi:hypothetical protein